MYIFLLSILLINDITQGVGGGLAKILHYMTWGGVQKSPNLGDIIYEQPLIGMDTSRHSRGARKIKVWSALIF